jgi:hypothetical protein
MDAAVAARVAEVGLYTFNKSVDPQLESAWFRNPGAYYYYNKAKNWRFL